MPTDLKKNLFCGEFTLATTPLEYGLCGPGGLAWRGGLGVTLEHLAKRHEITSGEWRVTDCHENNTAAGRGFTLQAHCRWLTALLTFTLTDDGGVVTDLRLTPTVKDLKLIRVCPFSPLAGGKGVALQDEDWVYDTGYQSWSSFGKRRLKQGSPALPLKLIRTASYNEANTYPGKPGEHVLHWCGAAGQPARGWVAMGAVSAHEAISTVHLGPAPTGGHALSLDMDTDGVLLGEGQPFDLDGAWLAFGPTLQNLMADYAALVARRMGARVKGHAPTGVCTWYELFTGVAQTDVTAAADTLYQVKGALPAELVLLDDGWQKDIGHWQHTNKKFDHSLAPLTRHVHQLGFGAGLWWAPFYARPTASLARQNPGWLIKNKHGRPRGAGFNPLWGGRVLAWDPSHPAVQEQLAAWTRQMVEEWDFDFLKMDFLFAGFLPGVRHRKDQTRCASARQALSVIREAAGEKTFLLGCGMPLLPAVGIFDGMRVGPDTDPHWDRPLVRLTAQGAEPAARGALITPLNRQWQHGVWWWNDPDCLMVREKNTHLTRTQARTQLRACVMTGGMRLLGDLPQHLDPTPLRWLSRAMGHWPLLTDMPGAEDHELPPLIRARLPDDPLGRQLLLLLNLTFEPQTITTPAELFPHPGPHLCLDVDQTHTTRWPSPPATLGRLQPGQSRLLLVGPVPQKPCFWAGDWSDSAGLGEWTQDEHAPHRLTVHLKGAMRCRGLLHLWLPPGLSASGKLAVLSPKGPTHRFGVDFSGKTHYTFDLTQTT